MSAVFVVCCISDLGDGPITRPGEFYRVCVSLGSNAAITAHLHWDR